MVFLHVALAVQSAWSVLSDHDGWGDNGFFREAFATKSLQAEEWLHRPPQVLWKLAKVFDRDKAMSSEYPGRLRLHQCILQCQLVRVPRVVGIQESQRPPSNIPARIVGRGCTQIAPQRDPPHPSCGYCLRALQYLRGVIGLASSTTMTSGRWFASH